jgi:hypothetical protein
LSSEGFVDIYNADLYGEIKRESVINARIGMFVLSCVEVGARGVYGCFDIDVEDVYERFETVKIFGVKTV